jgi:hypothetical protein
MKTTIAVYEKHLTAVKAINALKKHLFSLKKVSIKNQSETIETNIQFIVNRKREFVPFIVVVTACAVLGMLTGFGAIEIPALRTLYGAGGLIGTLAGVIAGVVIGGLVSILFTVFKKKNEQLMDFESIFQNGKYELVVDGTAKDIDRAERILLKEYLDTYVPPGL